MRRRRGARRDPTFVAGVGGGGDRDQRDCSLNENEKKPNEKILRSSLVSVDAGVDGSTARNDRTGGTDDDNSRNSTKKVSTIACGGEEERRHYPAPRVVGGRKKSLLVAYLLLFTGGVAGWHHWYLERDYHAILTTLTCGGFVLGIIRDTVRLPRWIRIYNREQKTINQLQREAYSNPKIPPQRMPASFVVFLMAVAANFMRVLIGPAAKRTRERGEDADDFEEIGEEGIVGSVTSHSAMVVEIAVILITTFIVYLASNAEEYVHAGFSRCFLRCMAIRILVYFFFTMLAVLLGLPRGGILPVPLPLRGVFGDSLAVIPWSSFISTVFIIDMAKYTRTWRKDFMNNRRSKLIFPGGKSLLRRFCSYCFFLCTLYGVIGIWLLLWKEVRFGKDLGESGPLWQNWDRFMARDDTRYMKHALDREYHVFKNRGTYFLLQKWYRTQTAATYAIQARTALDLPLSGTLEEREVKKAYRKMSLKLHPDRQHGRTEEEKRQIKHQFLRVTWASKYLLDDDAGPPPDDLNW